MKIEFKKILIALIWIVIIGLLLYFGIKLFSPNKEYPLSSNVSKIVIERL